jgi:hypothetical protein
LKVDGSASLDCRIFGRLRPVRIVRKRGAMHPLKRSPQRQANHPTGWARMGFGHCRSQVSISAGDSAMEGRPFRWRGVPAGSHLCPQASIRCEMQCYMQMGA